MDTMLGSVSSYYDNEQEAWIATATSDMSDYPYRKYKIKACDEFVAAIALLELHGFDSIECFDNPDGWEVEDIT